MSYFTRKKTTELNFLILKYKIRKYINFLSVCKSFSRLEIFLHVLISECNSLKQQTLVKMQLHITCYLILNRFFIFLILLILLILFFAIAQLPSLAATVTMVQNIVNSGNF